VCARVRMKASQAFSPLLFADAGRVTYITWGGERRMSKKKKKKDLAELEQREISPLGWRWQMGLIPRNNW